MTRLWTSILTVDLHKLKFNNNILLKILKASMNETKEKMKRYKELFMNVKAVMRQNPIENE